jgi:hypothetical protein
MGVKQFQYEFAGFPLLKRERNIIYFPGAWQDEAPDLVEHPAVHEEPRPSFAEHCGAFKGVDFGGNPTGGRIIWALYHRRIHSIEELARTPTAQLLDCRCFGQKTFERIQTALKNCNIASEAWGIPKAAVTQQEN